MERHSESFGRLLKAGMAGIAYIEAKTQQAIEAELGSLLGVAGVTLQRYKAGHLPPYPESIELLAEACVQRGLVGRQWLERFVQAARHPAASSRALMARLFPEALAVHTPVPRPNLPPPTYAHFVMRQTAYQDVVAGLRSALPATMVVSLGGMGKTSLVRALAHDCLEGQGNAPRFAAVVWVSDKDRPGTTNVSTTLDEIARSLDYPGLAALPFVERGREIEQLLRRQPVLLVVDNAETITDTALFAWLMRVPEPSKALLTSRFLLPQLGTAYVVQLQPMSKVETRQLVADWLQRSRLREIKGAADQLQPIVDSIGGNPKATELALSLLHHRSRDEVLAQVQTAGETLFDELFASVWELLDRDAQRIMLALPLFPTSVGAEALAFCADLPPTAFTRSAVRLADLSMLDIERTDFSGLPRYNAHPLVRAYSRARFAELRAADQRDLYQRWLAWCIDIAASVGFCWNDLDRLDILDSEYEAIQSAIVWSADHQEDQAVISLVEGVRYYYNVRGLWGEDEIRNYERRAEAARRLGDHANEVIALAHHVQVWSKQGQLEQAAPLIGRLIEIGEHLYNAVLAEVAAQPDRFLEDNPRTTAAFEYAHALALHARARQHLEHAKQHWQSLLGLSVVLQGQKYVVNRRWLATVYLQQGDLETARELFAASLHDAQSINDSRSITGNRLKLAQIDLQRGDIASAMTALEGCRATALRYHDRRRLAEYHMVFAQILAQRGDRNEAAHEWSTALDLFERLGMQEEAAAIRKTAAML